MIGPALLTVAQVADEVGISARAVRAAIAENRLVATKSGRDWVVTPAAVRRFKARRAAS